VVENPKMGENTHHLCAKYKCIHIVTEPGANYARNTGIQFAKSKLIGILDDDVLVKNDWVERAITVSKLYPNFGVLGGKVELLFDGGKPRWLEGYFKVLLSEVDWGEGIIELTDKYLVSANMVFSKDNWEKLGGLDSRIGYKLNDLISNDEVEFQQSIAVWSKPGLLYDGGLVATHVIPVERTQISWMKKRFYGQGVADAIYSSKKYGGQPLSEIFHDVVQHHGLNFVAQEETNKVREKIANEEITREYIMNMCICKTAYMTGLIEGLTNSNIKEQK